MNSSELDAHQYYFERYLRGKLSDEERVDFEQQIITDEHLRLLLEEYKLNRQKILHNLQHQNVRRRKNNLLINLIFFLISVAGITLAVKYYIENKALKTAQNQNKNIIAKLVDYIPFVKRNQPLTAKDSVIKPEFSKPKLNKQPALTKSIYPDSVFIDTVILPLKRQVIQDKLLLYKQTLDSSLKEADILMLYQKKHDLSINDYGKPIGLKIGLSDERKYQFNQHNLFIYTNQYPLSIPIVYDEGELIWLDDNNEIILNQDNQIHPF